MNDPYSILGVSPNASESDIKKAYYELVRKYHPDNYHDNPLSDLAQEKMKEVNEAYNSIIRSRSNSNGYSPGGGYGGSSSAGSPEGARVRAAIVAGDINQAEALLRAFHTRNAEWNFLMGSVCYRKGWLDDAYNYFNAASSMEPTNSEYRQAFMNMNRGGQAYSPYGRGPVAHQGCDACDCCATMLCLNMCCRCTI